MDRLEQAEKPLTGNHYQFISDEEGVDPSDLAPIDQLIMDRVIEVHGQLEDGQKLVVLFGEVHTEPTTIMPQISCVRNLAKLINPEGDEDVVPLIVGQEASHLDAAIRCLGSIDKIQNVSNPDFLEAYIAQEPAQTFNVMGLKRDRGNQTAAYSELMFINACLAHGVPTLCCDAYDKGGYLLAYDALAVDTAWEHYGINIKEDPLSASPGYDGETTGFQVRNLVMAQRIMDHMEAWDAPIMVMPTGLRHIYGDEPEGIPHDTSLVKLLEDQGYKTLVVNLLSPSRAVDFREMVSDEVLQKYPDHIVIEGMCGPVFINGEIAEEEYGATIDVLEALGIFDASRETDFIFGVLAQNYSGEECPFNFEVNLPEMDDLQDMFAHFYQQAVDGLTQEEVESYFVAGDQCEPET